MSQRILVTGAAGFIGSHFIEHLLKATDWEICILDKLSYASSGLDRLNDIEAFKSVLTDMQQHRVSFFATDLCHTIPEGLAQEIGAVDYIVHMAAETHVDNSIIDPWPFVQSNVIGTFHLLEFARKLNSRLKRFVYFSTDEVFGPAPVGIAYKEWARYNSTNPYSATKAAGEELCLAWSNTFKVPISITHTMNNFGERQHSEKFIPMVVRNILQGSTIKVHSDPTRTVSGSRFYIHARNTAAAVLFLLMKPGIKFRDKFNVVGEQEVSNLELVYLIDKFLREIVGNKGCPSLEVEMVDFHSSRPGHDLRYALDGTKMQRLGWSPPKTFEQSLQKTVNWMIDPQHMKWLLTKTPR